MFHSTINSVFNNKFYMGYSYLNTNIHGIYTITTLGTEKLVCEIMSLLQKSKLEMRTFDYDYFNINIA